LELLRDNVQGDVTHVIDGLCARFNGIPVLESSVRNLASGAQQLKLVYDRILNVYTFSNIDAHKAVRSHHWCGGGKWEHPYLEVVEKKQTATGWEPTKKFKPLNMFPGVQVHPYGTSQICTCCQRNPIEMVNESSETHFVIEEGGLVNLGGGHVIALLDKKDPKQTDYDRAVDERRLRKEKKHAPYRYPVEPKRVEKSELIKLIRRQLRRPQESTRSKDTSQSRYFCVFVDCSHVMHADENAAINIVRKWVRDNKVRERDSA
jgi:hypothetical protein